MIHSVGVRSVVGEREVKSTRDLELYLRNSKLIKAANFLNPL